MRAVIKTAIKPAGRVLGIWTLAFVLAGCGGEGSPEETTTASVTSESDSAPSSESKAAPGSPSTPGGGAGAALVQKDKNSAVPRKIIYTADISLAVEKLNPAQQKLLALVRQYKGYVAETEVNGQTGAPRTGRWKIRVPVDGYQNFLDAVSKIGEVQTLTTGSDDVSEEYYDIEARLRNKRVEEARLIQHLQRSTAKLSDILMVEKEISRVRGEIEQMEGRLRVLANLTSLTTLTITLNEIKDYVAPAPATFGTEIARSFQSSFGGLINFGKSIVILIVALFPWLVVLAIIAIPIWKLRRRSKPAPPTDD